MTQESVAATALITLALIASLGDAAWRQEQALQEGRRAMRMQTFMYRLFKLANWNYTGKPAATVPEFLALGVKMLPDYIKGLPISARPSWAWLNRCTRTAIWTAPRRSSPR
jgi:hypothetical protein